jgi:hypothetical protein
MGLIQFGIPKNLVLWLIEIGGYQWFIETGTNQAETAIWAAPHFEQVVTIEGFKELYDKAIALPDRPTNVEFLLGDSGVLLPSVVNKRSSPAILWLDAHWCGSNTFGTIHECPLLAEIKAINTSSVDHVI